MKLILTLATFLIIINLGYSQKVKNEIEITPTLRYDKYPEFSYNYGGRVSTNYLKMKGISWGIISDYKKFIIKSFYFNAGLGYYKYAFNKLTNRHPPFGTGDAREVDYPKYRTWLIIFATDRYWYNTISGNFGLGKRFNLKNGLCSDVGITWNHYYTYSKTYHITYDNPSYPIDNSYTASEHRYFGYDITVNAGIKKSVGKFQVGPSIIIPLYSRWKKDKEFDENPNEKRDKWFNGAGIAITVCKSINL